MQPGAQESWSMSVIHSLSYERSHLEQHALTFNWTNCQVLPEASQRREGHHSAVHVCQIKLFSKYQDGLQGSWLDMLALRLDNFGQ